MIIAVGEAMVVLTGMIDLSPESVLASSGVIIATLDIILGVPVYISIPITLVYGAIIGLANGLLVVKAKIPSFVVTLGMYWGLRGLAMVISGGYPISPSSVSPTRPLSFEFVAGNLSNFPIMVIIAITIAIFFHLYVSGFKIGRNIYAIGGNELAARYCGINVNGTKIFVFVMSGLMGVLIIHHSSFSSGEVVLPLVEIHIPLGIWAIPEPTEEGPLPLGSLIGVNLYASILGQYFKDHNILFKWFFGSPEDDTFLESFKLTVDVLRTIKSLKNSCIGLIGGIAQGFYDLYFDEL